MSRISADDVRKVAKLARLDLPEDKVATHPDNWNRSWNTSANWSRWTPRESRKPPVPLK